MWRCDARDLCAGGRGDSTCCTSDLSGIEGEGEKEGVCVKVFVCEGVQGRGCVEIRCSYTFVSTYTLRLPCINLCVQKTVPFPGVVWECNFIIVYTVNSVALSCSHE